MNETKQTKHGVIIDIETTGFEPTSGDRIVEIAAWRLEDVELSGEPFHTYVCPEREVPQAAVNVHGLDDAFLADMPKLSEVAPHFLEFIGDAPLVAHNAGFDRAFLNAELERAGKPPIPTERFTDTYEMAKKLFPGEPASLDALVKRFGIHIGSDGPMSAVIDVQYIAEVYKRLATHDAAMPD